MYVQNQDEIIICPICKGTAVIENNTQRGPIIKFNKIECYNCDGSGRMLKITNIKIVPFKPIEL